MHLMWIWNKSIHQILQFSFSFRSEGKDKLALIQIKETQSVEHKLLFFKLEIVKMYCLGFKGTK